MEPTTVIKKPIVTEILPGKKFWPAEDYHQDFWKKDPVRYRTYREGCGRDRRLAQLWGARLGFWAGPAAWLTTTAVLGYLGDAVPEPREDGARLRTGQSALVLEARDDTVVPVASREALWAAVSASPAAVAKPSAQTVARSGVERILIPGDHLGPGQDEMIRGLFDRAVKWLRGRGWFSR